MAIPNLSNFEKPSKFQGTVIKQNTNMKITKENWEIVNKMQEIKIAKKSLSE